MTPAIPYISAVLAGVVAAAAVSENGAMKAFLIVSILNLVSCGMNFRPSRSSSLTFLNWSALNAIGRVYHLEGHVDVIGVKPREEKLLEITYRLCVI